MSASDELYARALQYRDNHVPECSAEASKVEAEKIFLELSQQGHKKAMHNYAVLQQKKWNYQLAMEWFTNAGLDASNRNIKAMKECGQIKEDLYLVVANDRSDTGNHGSPIMDGVYGKAVDMTHIHSFGGNATTCDISRSARQGAKHIVADALTFDFAKKYNLKHVLIERLPTINPNKPCLGIGEGPIDFDTREAGFATTFESDAKMNYFGSVVHNLSKAMAPGAILEIEWDPYTMQWHLHREECEEFHILNPFHGFIRTEAAALGAQCTDPRIYVGDLPSKLQVIAREYGKKFRVEIEYWYAQGVSCSVQEISDRMRAEAELFERILHSRQLAFVEGNVRTDPTEKAVLAMKNAVFDNFNPQLSPEMLVQLPDGRKGRVYAANTLVADSLLGMAQGSLAVQNNTPYAKRYLESIGFKEVVIERRTNIHNGRKNVWMVQAVKG